MNRVDYQLYGARTLAIRGEALPHARLTEVDVRAIRANPRGLTARQLGEAFGVHHRTIEKVRAGETWSHV